MAGADRQVRRDYGVSAARAELAELAGREYAYGFSTDVDSPPRRKSWAGSSTGTATSCGPRRPSGYWRSPGGYEDAVGEVAEECPGECIPIEE